MSWAVGLRGGLVALAVGACQPDAPAPVTHAPPVVVAPAVVAHPTPPAPPVARARPAQLRQVTIKALGMYCEESCPLKVRTALAAIPAVYELGFDLSNESIFISFDGALGTAKDVTRPMIAAIKGAGFDPWLARESWPADASVQIVAAE